MSHRLWWLVPAFGLGLAVSNLSWGNQQSDAGKERAKIFQTQLETARKTFETVWTDQEFRNVEMPYQWSRRWLEAERLVKDKKQDHVAAAKAHLDRMLQLRQTTNDLFQQKLVTREQISAADYFIAEAQLWLLQANQ